MKLKLEVVLSTSIKRKKPWPRFCWLGQEKENVFLLDDKRISEINIVSGRTKKKTPKLHQLLNNVVTMATSQNGMWLCGILASGELFLWNKDKDLLKTAASVPEVVQMITSAQENSTKLCLQVSCDGIRVLLVAIQGQVFLWECTDVRDFAGLRDGPVKGHWAHIQPLEESRLPSSQDKEASQHTIFVKTEVMGDVCLSAFVFTSGKQLIITVLKIQWKEGHVWVGSVGYSIQWATKTYPMSHLTPPCHPVKSRGALVPAFSPDGRLLAVVLNQRKPKATQVLFVSSQNFISISSGLGGCGSKKKDIPSKYIRSYWVGSISWSPGGLFLACVLKRGSLLMLAPLGGLLTLSSSGCSVDFGPAHFLPLHPLVTYRPPISAGKGEASLSSSSMSVRDILRQRYSVTWHPRLLYLIVSDGYMATVMRVLDKPSPALFLKSLLKDTGKDLEKLSHKLDKSQAHVKAWLESVSCLNLDNSNSFEELNYTVPRRPKTSDTTVSAATDASRLPLFLQDQQTLGATRELLGSMQTFLESESDIEGLPAGPHVEDVGRLEFASMFDTLHALETYNETAYLDFDEIEMTPLRRELGRIQRRLLTAWAFGMLLGADVEHRLHLLKHTLRCVVRFAALLHLMPSSMVHTGEQNTPTFACLLRLTKALLSFLPWGSADRLHCLGLLVEFSKWIVRLLLTPRPDSHQTGHLLVSSQSLSHVMLILQLVSDSLDHAYSLKHKTYWSSEEEVSPSQPHVWPSDVYQIPLLQNGTMERSSLVHQLLPVPKRPSSRLLGTWQLVYDITQQYAEELTKFRGSDGVKEEEEKLSVIMSHIQSALQATGGSLEDGPSLLTYPAEHLFLCGLYSKSADSLQLQICQEANKSCGRSVFQEMRLCLALLYSLLSQYCLKEAQALGDHMAQLILVWTGNREDSLTAPTPDHLPCSWLPMNLHLDAAFAVIQTLGRFMASYFTNQPLFILPAHNVAILPPLHLLQVQSVDRLVPLCQENVARSVRQQHLSEVWTVDYALDLLLLGGLLPEAVWLAYHLGDWKTAVTLSLACTSYCSEYFDFTQLRRRELHLPAVLRPESIFQAELEGLLGNQTYSPKNTVKYDDKSFTNPLEGEDWNLLQASLQEILKASVMAGVNIVSSPLCSLLEKAKNLCSSLPTLVPTALYLPSPPLYCPQPSPNTQDQIGTVEWSGTEVSCRHEVSGILQRLLLLLRSARCFHPAAQWYIGRLRRARHILHKIKKKYSYPSAAQEEKTFPEELVKLITPGGHFKRRPNKDGHLDSDIIQTIICFRELCALCWMLHVRDQLSLHCRKYQAARQHERETEVISDDSDVNSTCADALRWARRLLPFSHFLTSEEVFQDLLLSLVSELPPLPMVADTLVQAFPQEEESVRVSLREKYKLLLQRLKQSRTFDGENKEANESMMIIFQHKKKQRRKHLARLQRHLAPLVLHLWEKEEDEENKGSKHGPSTMEQLSQSGAKQLGTNLSTNTVTDAAFQPVYSDVDTVNSSESVSIEQHCRAMTSGKGAKKRSKNVKKTENVIQEKSLITEERKKEQLSLPVIGTWEFELEDEEYLNFLELFLSYVLERDSADGGDPSGELPLLRGFCSELRERELHSLTFDVLTTVHRRQRSESHPVRKHLSNAPPVFRAGSCYKPAKQNTTHELKTSSPWTEEPISQASPSVSSYLEQTTGKQRGLFGLRQQDDAPSTRVKATILVSEASPFKQGLNTGQPSESSRFGSSVSAEAVTDLQQGLDPNLEAQFPKLGRLLEWMVRWADKRALLGHHGKKEKDKDDEGIVIRVKVTTPAILTSLSLLECKFTALPQTGRYISHIPVPEMQWTVSPVLQPEVEKKLERESSVDTGYPGSGNTPIAGPVHNLQQEQLDSCTDEPDDRMFQRTPSSVDQAELNFNAQQELVSSQQLSFNDLDITPEKEDRSGDSKSLDVLSSGSIEGVSGNVCTPETSLKLEDLDYSEKAEHVSNSSSDVSPEHPEAPAPPTIRPKTTLHAEFSNSSGTPLHNTSVASPNSQPQNCTAGAAAPDPLISNQPLITSPMRQRLGEDLFRLVQHINYMSLGEVLGASFSNLQRAQQSSSVALPEMNSSHPNMQTSSNNKITTEPNVLPGVTQTVDFVPNSRSSDHPLNQIMSHEFADQPVMQSSANRSVPLPANDTCAQVNYQEMQPLSVQADSPNIQQRVKRRMIPPSQGLLVTSDSCPAIRNTLSLPLPDDSAQKDCPPEMLGLKLLKLHHPVMSQDSAPHGPPMVHTTKSLQSYQSNLKQNYQATWKKKSGEQRNEFSVPTKHLRFDPPRDPNPRNSQPPMWSSGQTVDHVFPLLHPTFPTQTHAPMQGLRLLQLQHVPHSNISFPKLSHPAVSRPAVISAPITGAPMIKLLHIDSGPKMMMSQAAPTGRMTRLMSMEELTSSEILRQDAEKTQLQLLKVDPSSENRVNSFNSSKRQKRREEKAKERKTEVTFRPNESIIPTPEAADVPVSEVPAGAEEITPGQEITGSSDSLLTAQRLLDMAWSTSAELHAFASTSKRPPECQDAFTNTDPASSPLLVDKAVSVQASVMINSPKRRSLCIFHEDPVQNTEKELPHKEDEILDLAGHQFISVLDLEDRMQYDALPSCPSPETQDVTSSPTPAELHVLATSAIRAATESQTPDTVQVDPPKPTISTDTPVEPPLFSHYEPRGVFERIIPRDSMMVDSSDSEICGAIKAQSLVPDGSSSTPPVWFSSRLTELDAQLAALKNIADHLETDFSNSRMLVKKIDKLSSPVKKTVILSVPLKAWTPRPDSDHLTKLKSCEENEEEQDEEHVFYKDSGNRRLEPPSNDSTSPFSQRAGPSYLHTSPGLKDHFSETYEILHELSDENLGQSELSDTAEMLDELVKEGYLSPTDWNRSTYQTESQSSRQEQQQSSWKSQKHALPEDERKDLRIWMRRKERERLAAYQKHRANLREREHKPFSSPPTRRSANRTHATLERTREEKEKFTLLKQYNQRTREACSLAADFLNSPENILQSSQRTRTVFVSNKRSPKSRSGPADPHHRPQSVDERHSQDLHRRLGLYRPVTSLPGDRLSQVTRRGMLSNTRNPSKHHAAGQSEGQRVGFQTKDGLNRTFSSGAALGRKTPKKHTQVEKMDQSESNRLHGLEASNMVLTELLGTWDDAVTGGVSEMDWLDNLSESAGSSLSKIDWAAIERMVAEEEVEHNEEKKVP